MNGVASKPSQEEYEALLRLWEETRPANAEAAWQRFLALRKAGWRSSGPYGSRDELYERDGQ